jgi:AcrR family transcriptional regulator
VSPAGRRPGSPETRQAILSAARAEFAAVGYTAASIRRVARRAGVDPALVYHYFTGKPELFVACLQLPADPRQVSMDARRGPLDGARIVERFLAQWEQDPADPGRSFVTLVQAVSSAAEWVGPVIEAYITGRLGADPEHRDLEHRDPEHPDPGPAG